MSRRVKEIVGVLAVWVVANVGYFYISGQFDVVLCLLGLFIAAWILVAHQRREEQVSREDPNARMKMLLALLAILVGSIAVNQFEQRVTGTHYSIRILMGSLYVWFCSLGLGKRERPLDWHKTERPAHDEPDAQPKHTQPLVSDW